MLWSKIIQPYLLDLACSTKPIRIQRGKIIPKARGNVLEIGFGSGLNLTFYNKDNIKKIFALEPSLGMQKKSKKNIIKSKIDVEFLTSFAEDIPLDDKSIDTVVCTYTLCSIEKPELALLEIKRVLKIDGIFLIIEHVKAPDAKVIKFQNKLEPFWKIIAGGCHLTHDTNRILEETGFNISSIEEMYLPGTPKFIGYNIWASLSNN